MLIALGTVAASPSPAPVQTAAFLTTDYSFDSGGTTLIGRLFLPRRSAGNVPLVVLVQGSDYDDANASIYWRLVAHTLAKNGIASFSFNKRGVAGSGGTQTDNFTIQASDVAAACRFASKLPGIARDSAGMYGVGQAGWIVPRAVRECNVKFIVLANPAGVSPAEQVGFYLRHQFRAAGMNVADASQALALHRALADYFATGRNYDKTQRLVRAAVKAKWYKRYLSVSAAIANDPATYAFYRDPLTWRADPSVYESMRVPILLLYAGHDESLDVERSIAIFQGAMRKIANADVTIHIFEAAGHSIHGPPIQPGYREYVAAWILAHKGQA